MQHLARGRVGAFRRAVDTVAEHRVADVLHVQPDLVLAPGVERQFDQGRGGAVGLPHDVVRDGRNTRLAGMREPSPSGRIALGHGRVDRADGGRGHAFDERHVLAVELVPSELRAAGLVRLARQRQGERARGVAIETVQRAHVATGAAAAVHVLAHPAEHGVFARAVVLVHRDGQQARRLVDDEDVLVFVQPAESRSRRPHRGAVHVEDDRGRGEHLGARVALDGAVHGDLAAFDGGADLRPGEAGLVGPEALVEPRA